MSLDRTNANSICQRPGAFGWSARGITVAARASRSRQGACWLPSVRVDSRSSCGRHLARGLGGRTIRWIEPASRRDRLRPLSGLPECAHARRLLSSRRERIWFFDVDGGTAAERASGSSRPEAAPSSSSTRRPIESATGICSAGNRGSGGPLVYLETRAECYSDHVDIAFRPGHRVHAQEPGRRVSGGRTAVSRSTIFTEDGVIVCAGTNSWRSRVVGLARMPNGGTAVHTQTNETQLLSPVPGAPSSSACPGGEMTSFGWQENFYVGGGLIVRGPGGTLAGSDAGLLRSRGGNPAETSP